MEQVARRIDQTARESDEVPNSAELPDSELGSDRRHAHTRALEQETGWRWDTSELGHFRTRPKLFRPDVLAWRREIIASTARGGVMLLAHLAGRALADVR